LARTNNCAVVDSCDSAMTAVHKTINPLTLYTDSDLHVALPWPELGRARRLPLTISDCYTHGPTADRLHAVTRFNDANLISYYSRLCNRLPRARSIGNIPHSILFFFLVMTADVAVTFRNHSH